MAIESGVVQTGDTELYYETQGQGEPLVLLHGNGEDAAYLRPLAALFAPHYRTITLETRGHGQSGRGERPLNFATFAGDVEAALDQLELERIHLLGFSDGGNTALTFGIRFPQRLKSLTAVGANRSPRGIRPLVQSAIVLGYAACGLFVPFSSKARSNWEILRIMVHHPHIRQEDLGRISCPTLVVAGEKDIVKERETRAIVAGIPGAQLAIVPGADHDLPGKYPQQLARQVRLFLEQEPNNKKEKD